MCSTKSEDGRPGWAKGTTRAWLAATLAVTFAVTAVIFAADPQAELRARTLWRPSTADRDVRAEKQALLERYADVAGRLRGGLLPLVDRHERMGAEAAASFAASRMMTVRDDRVTVIVVPVNALLTDAAAQLIARVGGQAIRSGEGYVEAEVPIGSLADLARRHDLIDHIRAPIRARPCAPIISEGVEKTGAGRWHQSGWTGAGVKVAVIDVGFIGLAQATAQNELPGDAIARDFTGEGLEATTEHGVGVAEIVHDIAPDAQLYLLKVAFETHLQSAVSYCKSNGIDIINFSAGFDGFNFYDGVAYSSMVPSPITIANDAAANGILWVNAAGNERRNHALIQWRDDIVEGVQDWAPDMNVNQIGWHDPGDIIAVFLTWNAWPTTNQDFDLYLLWSPDEHSGWQLAGGSEFPQSGSEPPLEWIGGEVSPGWSGYYGFAIEKYAATTTPTFVVRTYFAPPQFYSYNNAVTPAPGSLTCPADAASVLTAGAIDEDVYATGPTEPYSSLGPNLGSYTGKPVVMKPDVCGADDTASWTYGTGFTGTSAASPHTAGLAALVLSRFPEYTAAQVRAYLEAETIDLGPAGKDNEFGYGPVVLPGCASATECDDGLFCNGAERCPSGACLAGTPPDCDDGVACTVDSCNEATESCDHLANDAVCDNDLFCDGLEICDPALDCQAGAPPNCDDSVGCTDDSCNEATDSCVNAANEAHCDDGLFCNGTETCDPVLDCQPGSHPCPNLFCDEVEDRCICTEPAECDDGLFCNGVEQCIGEACQPGTPVDCDDGVGCTDDSCDEGTDSCDHAADAARCDNGLFCDGAETCDPVLDCQAGTPPDCDDGVGCTDDSCSPATDSCVNVANDAACDNGLFCDGAETCDPGLDCRTGPPPCDDGVGCTDDFCNEATDSCANAGNNAHCDNGLFCDGAETCHPTLDCRAGAPPCDDGVGCTDDRCNEASQSCENVADHARCNNGQFCDGAETCDAVQGCRTGAAPCVDQVCNEAGDFCVECESAVNCDDGLFCNGPERCDGGACRAGAAPCDDGVSCSDDTCNESTDECTHTANDAECDNGKFCDGTESCDPVSGCQAGDDPCPDQACDETDNACICSADEHCDDGVFCNGAERCVSGACRAGTPPCPADELCIEPNQACFECTVAAQCADGDPCTVDSCPNGRCAHALTRDCQDDDADGLSNSADLCPATPFGEAVDSAGCSCSQRDADADGVDDCEDECGDTPRGEPADVAGCSCSQRDSDGDSVVDCDDDCADTAAGEGVDAAGCSTGQLDEDGDGVPDEGDACPDTPAGAAVGADGCATTEVPEDPTVPQPLDGDGDGVPDTRDLCPTTPVGFAVDREGCPLGDGEGEPGSRRPSSSLCGSFGLIGWLMLPVGLFSFKRRSARAGTRNRQ